MKKLTLLTITLSLLVCFNGICQNEEKQILDLENIILNLQDSINKIELRIAELKSHVLSKSISEDVVRLSVREGGKLKESLSGSVLVIFKDDDKIMVDMNYYKEGYFKACFNNTCGYINEIWIKRDDVFDRLKELYKTKKRLTNIQKIDDEIKLQKEQAELQEKEWIKKYGKTVYDELKEGYIYIGMSQEMATISRGEADHVNRTVGSWGVHEQWVYDNGTYLYFENGKLTSWQD